MTLWQTEEKCPRPNKALEIRINLAVNGVCNADYLELGEDPVPRQTVTNFLQRINSKPITYENASPQINQALLSQRQVEYVEDIIVTRDTANLGMKRR